MLYTRGRNVHTVSSRPNPLLRRNKLLLPAINKVTFCWDLHKSIINMCIGCCYGVLTNHYNERRTKPAVEQQPLLYTPWTLAGQLQLQQSTAAVQPAVLSTICCPTTKRPTIELNCCNCPCCSISNCTPSLLLQLHQLCCYCCNI